MRKPWKSSEGYTFESEDIIDKISNVFWRVNID